MLNVNEKDIDKITAAFHYLLRGLKPEPIKLPDNYPENEIKQVVAYINKFINEYEDFSNILQILSTGELDVDIPKSKILTVQYLKNLQANLRHLTWKTQQISNGDFSQKVDFMGDFSIAFNSMTKQLKDAFEKIEMQNKELAEAYQVIKKEKEKSDKLLLNILPARVADDLKQFGKTTPEYFNNVTVFFSDIVGFTKKTSEIAPEYLIDELNILFTAFDNIIEENNCERIKTIGDAYMAVCGMPVKNEDHALNIMNSAIEIIKFLRNRNRTSESNWEIRIGIHSGNVVGSVVGVKKYIYDIFGDTINTASRMEKHSEPMRINISETTYAILKDKFTFNERGAVEVKGKGIMKMYYVVD